MRCALAAVLVLAASCSKCSKDAVDAGAPIPDAAVEAADASLAAAPARDASVGPTDSELLAAYEKDCAFVAQRDYYEREQDKRGDECVARNSEACTSDTFGCCGKGEACRVDCGIGCQTCSSMCAQTCNGCKADCGQRAECLRGCAKGRLDCRHTCLETRTKCLTAACAAVETLCENEAEAQRKKKCPDCAELGQCMWEDGFKDDHEKCLGRYPENAKECLEWCFQE